MYRARVLLGTCGTALAVSAVNYNRTAASEPRNFRSPEPNSHAPPKFDGNTVLDDKKLKDILTKNQVTAKIVGGEFHACTFAANTPIEDSYAVLDGVGPNKDVTLLGMFDGHSGGTTSLFCRDHLFSFILDSWKKNNSAAGCHLQKEPFLAADKYFLDWAQTQSDCSGACYNVVRVKDKQLEVANGGDCRAVLGRVSGNSYEAVALSRDHEISSNPDEKARLLREHPGEPDVVFHDRIKGHLQPTRGMGDGIYKRIEFYSFRPRYLQRHGTDWHPPYSTVEPDITTHSAPPGSFLVMATDGLFLDLSNQEVVNVVGDVIKKGRNDGGMNAATSLVQAALVAASHREQPKAWNFYAPSPAALKEHAQHYLSQLFTHTGDRRQVHDDITVLVVFLDDPKSKL